MVWVATLGFVSRLKASVICREERGGKDPNICRLVGYYLQLRPAFSACSFPSRLARFLPGLAVRVGAEGSGAAVGEEQERWAPRKAVLL